MAEVTVTMLVQTAAMVRGQLIRLAEGQSVRVPEDVAESWELDGIAEVGTAKDAPRAHAQAAREEYARRADQTEGVRAQRRYDRMIQARGGRSVTPEQLPDEEVETTTEGAPEEPPPDQSDEVKPEEAPETAEASRQSRTSTAARRVT